MEIHNLEIEKLLTELSKKYPQIQVGEEDDWDWWQKGLRMLRDGNLTDAVERFEQLIVAQPEHHDGYEGLALTYAKMGRKSEAILLIDHAIALARKFLEEDALDIEVLDEIVAKKKRIEQLP